MDPKPVDSTLQEGTYLFMTCVLRIEDMTSTRVFCPVFHCSYEMDYSRAGESLLLI